MIENTIAIKDAIDAIKAGDWNGKSFEEVVADFFEIIAMSVTNIERGDEQLTLNFIKPIQENPSLVGINELKNKDKSKLVKEIIDILIDEATKQNADNNVVEELEQIKNLMV